MNYVLCITVGGALFATRVPIHQLPVGSHLLEAAGPQLSIKGMSWGFKGFRYQ